MKGKKSKRATKLGKEEKEAKLRKKVWEVVDSVKKSLEENIGCTLEEDADTDNESLPVYQVMMMGKKFDWEVPVKIIFNPTGTISLRYQLSFGITEAYEESAKELARWFKAHANYMEETEQKVLELGFREDGSKIDGIRDMDFYYRKDYSFDQTEELPKDIEELSYID